jgi:hypothetical protein
MTGEIDRLLADWRALEEPLRARLGTPPPGLSPLPNLVAVNLSVTNHPVAADAINAIPGPARTWTSGGATALRWMGSGSPPTAPEAPALSKREPAGG